ncbi:hypothetical protein ACFL1A_02140 [Patescibacteria group bacterium]
MGKLFNHSRIRILLGISPLLTIILYVFLAIYGIHTNWNFYAILLLLFSIISIFTPWIKVNKKPKIGLLIVSSKYWFFVKIIISFAFSMLLFITLSDLYQGPLNYQGPCTVKDAHSTTSYAWYAFGGGITGPNEIIFRTNGRKYKIYISYKQMLNLKGREYDISKKEFYCNSDIKIIFLKNLGVKLDLNIL